MQKSFLIFSFIAALALNTVAQKLTITPGLHWQEYGFITRNVKRADYVVPKPLKAFNLFGQINYKKGNTCFSIEALPSTLSNNFKIKDLYLNDTSLGIRNSVYGNAIDHIIFSLAVARNFNNNPQNASKKIIPWYKVGLGISLNRSNQYFNEQYSYWKDGEETKYNFNSYFEYITKIGNGYFLCTSLGANFKNRKRKNVITAEFYINLGLKKMVKYDVTYEYGSYLYPTRNIDSQKYTRVSNYIVNSRGTVFGLKVGVPIRLIK